VGGSPDPRRAALRFVLGFAVLMVAGNLALSLTAVDRGLVEPWTRANTATAAALSNAIGVEAVAEGTRITTGAARLDVRKGCNGVHALMILLGAVLAFPASWTARALGVVGGSVAIFGFNLVRLVNLVAVAHHRPAWLELFHVYVWQTLIVLIAFFLFVAWGFAATRNARADGPIAASSR